MASRPAGVVTRAAFAACLVWAAPAACLARSITIEDFAVAIDVDGAGMLDVVETIRLRFDGSWNGIHRRIPVVYRTARGEDYRLRLSVVAVTDDRGAALRYELRQDRHYESLRIFVPGAADASRTVVVRYRVGRALRFFPDHDELYWNVTGDEWAFPIAAARARITLPGALVNLRVNAFTGPFGARERSATISVDGVRQAADEAFRPAGESPPPPGGRHVVEIEASRPLGIREGLTAAVAWNPGVIRRPSPREELLARAWDNLGPLLLAAALALAPVVAFAVLLRRWLVKGRDPATGPVVVQYEPPAGLGPAEVGTLVDNSPDIRDLMALLVDLAVKGCIRIRQTAAGGWLSRARYAFDLLVPEDRWPALPGSERVFLEALFDDRRGDPEAAASGVVSSVTSDALEHRFFKRLPDIRSAIFDGLVAGGHYVERPDHVVKAYVAAALTLGLVLAAAPFVAAAVVPRLAEAGVGILGVGAGVLTSIIIGGFGFVMPARTARGATARGAILGFQEFLTRVESHRLASLPLTPELFERYLPYAMALGVEGRWAKAFEGICQEPPQWYVGSGPVVSFDPVVFGDDLGRMSAVTATAMQSGPRSSEG
ncbi:MAG: DUF2207 domain-containing protein, partial [Planctomycetia bacterium]|nr:DUF2207 domain-containing protein [Planctomycetia bacterium]